MSGLETAAERLRGRMAGGFDGTAVFVLTGLGRIVVDADGVRAGGVRAGGEAAADVTLTAAPETFEAILGGELSATGAFMSGKLQVDGDMGAAMRLASVLS